MSKGQTKKTREAAGNRRKLTRAEKKQIAAVIRQAKGDGKAHTAQQTIPYLAMYPDGICKVAQRRYSPKMLNVFSPPGGVCVMSLFTPSMANTPSTIPI